MPPNPTSAMRPGVLLLKSSPCRRSVLSQPPLGIITIVRVVVGMSLAIEAALRLLPASALFLQLPHPQQRHQPNNTNTLPPPILPLKGSTSRTTTHPRSHTYPLRQCPLTPSTPPRQLQQPTPHHPAITAAATSVVYNKVVGRQHRRIQLLCEEEAFYKLLHPQHLRPASMSLRVHHCPLQPPPKRLAGLYPR